MKCTVQKEKKGKRGLMSNTEPGESKGQGDDQAELKETRAGEWVHFKKQIITRN